MIRNGILVCSQEGNLGASGDYNNLPLRISVTRPKEKYKMRLTYQAPESVSIGKTYPAAAFELRNEWGLEEVNLDDKLKEAKSRLNLPDNSNSATRAQ